MDFINFKASYICDAISKVIKDYKKSFNEDNNNGNELNGLLEHVSSFDVKFSNNQSINYSKLNSVLAIANNILTRGLPTIAPILIEETFVKCGLVNDNIRPYEYNFDNANFELQYELIFKLLHIVEPNLNISRESYNGNLGSNSEWIFLNNTLSNYPFLKQILQSQRSFQTINEEVVGERTVDFSYSSPYHQIDNNKNNNNRSRGFIIEVDGIHHQQYEYKIYDKYRDENALEANFETLRQPIGAEDITNIDLENLFSRSSYQIYAENHIRNIDDFLSVYTLIFVPIAVARIQKTLIEYLLRNDDLLGNNTLKIVAIERDFPCSALAVQILKQTIKSITNILDSKEQFNFPDFELTIVQNEKYVYNKNLHLGCELLNINQINLDDFDLVIDHSILRRSNIYRENDIFYNYENTLRIRSSHFVDNSFGLKRKIYCADLVTYKNLVSRQNDGSFKINNDYEDSIKYFLQNIFRKQEFRPGQLPIISRALQQKPVIGLLPTGSGKSITYQLSALLQPGLTLIVDPIKSLMEDQVRVLRENWIDSCSFINSNLTRIEKANNLTDFYYGESLFFFVTPERFVMDEFRKIVSNISSNLFALDFSYCIIDEVHCVSEWGHDFRTTYLMLGKNAQLWCSTRNSTFQDRQEKPTAKKINLIGLTATASFDVLADIEKELRIEGNDSADAIISIDNTIRAELYFDVIESELEFTDDTNYINSQYLRRKIGESKQSGIREYIDNIANKISSIDEVAIKNSLKQHYEEFEIAKSQYIEELINNSLSLVNVDPNEENNKIPTIYFCPHTKGSIGVTRAANPRRVEPDAIIREVFENLTNIPIQLRGYFFGGDEYVPAQIRANIQKFFIEFLTGNKSLMVCTKAFGMGIDKGDIRQIHHINISSSPESYIQEAGRAGRNKQKSICAISINRQFFFSVKEEVFIENQTQFEFITNRKNARNIVEEYNSFQNSFFDKYYVSKEILINRLNEVNFAVSDRYILKHNPDKNVNKFFHSNSYKGVTTEIYQLHRLLNYNDGINGKRLKMSLDRYNSEFEENIKCRLQVEEDWAGILWFNNNEGDALGRCNTNLINPVVLIDGLGPNSAPDFDRANSLLQFLTEHKNSVEFDGNLFNFLNEEITEGLNEGLSMIDYFYQVNQNNYSYKIPSFLPNLGIEEKLEIALGLSLLPLFQDHNSTAKFLKSLKNKSYNFIDFVFRIEEIWDINVIGNLNFESIKKDLISQYYSEINKQDTSRLIYRLYSIGFI